MTLLAEVIASVTVAASHTTIDRVEVSQAQYDALRALAVEEPTVFSDRRLRGSDAIFGVTVVIVDEPLPRPVIVYRDGRRDEGC